MCKGGRCLGVVDDAQGCLMLLVIPYVQRVFKLFYI